MLDIRTSELDERGDRVIEIDLPGLRDHLDDIRRTLRIKGDFDVGYRVEQGARVKAGYVDLQRPSLSLRFARGQDPDGVWELSLDAADPGGRWERPLWRQSLFVQKQISRTDAEIDALAQRYAPVFVFSGEERYYPVSLGTLFTAPEILACTEVMKLRTVFGKERVPLARLGEFMRFNGHRDYLLDFNVLSMKRSVFAQIGGDPRSATLYYSYFEDPSSDRFFINYHLFYAYDTKTGLARVTGIGPHVFDRESMVMVFGGDERPRSMIISGHLENQTIFFLKKLKVWSQGRLRVKYDDPRTLKLGAHPVIAVAEGSHALYPTSGVYQLSLLREVAGYLDPALLRADAADRRINGAIRPEQFLVPPTLRPRVERAIPNYRLPSLGLDRLTSHIGEPSATHDGHAAYLTFSGFWVDVPGPQNARFPPFTRKVAEITDWVDGAYAWEWDDVPDTYHENNGIILRFLHENLEDF